MKTKRPIGEAMERVRWLISELAPLCEKVEVAGSVRRKSAEVGDIEIVCIPLPALDMFGNETEKTMVDEWISASGIVPLKNGPKWKEFMHDGFQVDLFLATRKNYGYILALRTGPASFSKRLVTSRSYGGIKPDSFVLKEGFVYVGGDVFDVPTEDELWKAWEVSPVPPELRG